MYRYIQFCVLCSLVLHEAVSLRPKLFYIYEFSDVLTDTWPSREQKLEEKTVWKHAFNENEGFGHFYNGTDYFETWQYSSFRLILSRLLRSKYRTRDISKASLFFIPYDSGADVYVSRKGAYRFHATPLLADWLLEHLPLLSALQRNNGYDHFYVHGSSLTAHPVHAKMKRIFDVCANATILTVEKLPGLPKRMRYLPFVQPIPMASMYHWRAAEGRSSVPALKPLQRKSEIFISYFASVNTSNPESNKLRIRLFEQCREASFRRNALILSQTPEFNKLCLHNQFIPGSNRDTVDAFDIMAAYEKSVYCLCPPGDSPIRRAIFDAVLAGCIPVVFQTGATPFPLHQYSWHISPEEIKDATVIVDATDHAKLFSVDIVKSLMDAYSPVDVRKKQQAIASLARKLQYSMPPDVRQYGIPSTREPMAVWDPPFKDAVDVILDRMMEKIEKYCPEQNRPEGNDRGNH